MLLLIPALAGFLWAFAKPEYKYNVSVEQESKTTVIKDIIVTNDKPEKITVIESRIITDNKKQDADSTAVVEQKTEIKYITCDSLSDPHSFLELQSPVIIEKDDMTLMSDSVKINKAPVKVDHVKHCALAT